jgi:hypothetical protein
MMDGQAATRGEHPPGGRIRARRRVPAIVVSNRATAPGDHVRARAPGTAGGRMALGIDGMKTGFIASGKHS